MGQQPLLPFHSGGEASQPSVTAQHTVAGHHNQQRIGTAGTPYCPRATPATYLSGYLPVTARRAIRDGTQRGPDPTAEFRTGRSKRKLGEIRILPGKIGIQQRNKPPKYGRHSLAALHRTNADVRHTVLCSRKEKRSDRRLVAAHRLHRHSVFM